MITQLTANTFWYEPGQILICWDQFKFPSTGPYYWEHSHLMLSRLSPYTPSIHKNLDPDLLFVNKMRGIWLNEYQPDLDQIFDSYEIMDNGKGWRGQIRVSECDLAYWLLQCGS